MADPIKGDGAYGVITLVIRNLIRKERPILSVSDALQLALEFGTFVVTLIGLIVQVIVAFHDNDDKRKKK